MSLKVTWNETSKQRKLNTESVAPLLPALVYWVTSLAEVHGSKLKAHAPRFKHADLKLTLGLALTRERQDMEKQLADPNLSPAVSVQSK